MTAACCTSYEDEDVLAWVLGDPAGFDDGELARHLAECPECLGRASEYRAMETGAVACRDGAVIRWRGFESPFGPTRIAASRDGLVELSWRAPSDDAFLAELEQRYRETPIVCDCDELTAAEDQLLEYFDRRRTAFELPVDLSRLTRFQRAVLGATASLGFGQVATYNDIARRIGRPKAARAVGNALGRNPVAIIVPCHRVVRSDGSLGGYTGGLEFKERLLRIEGRRDLLTT